MPRIQRGNVVLHIKEYEVPRYLQLGYNLTDDSGKVIKEAIPHDAGALQKAYLEHTTKITELENQVAKLTQELTTLKANKVQKPVQQSKNANHSGQTKKQNTNK